MSKRTSSSSTKLEKRLRIEHEIFLTLLEDIENMFSFTHVRSPGRGLVLSEKSGSTEPSSQVSGKSVPSAPFFTFLQTSKGSKPPPVILPLLVPPVVPLLLVPRAAYELAIDPDLEDVVTGYKKTLQDDLARIDELILRSR